MNLCSSVVYSFKRKICPNINRREKYFIDDFIGINSIIKANDFSTTSLAFFNLILVISQQDNALFELKKNLIKKEINFIIKEYNFLDSFLKKFKNFNLWHQISWLFKKETNWKLLDFCKYFWRLISGDPKNIHLWNFFVRSKITQSISLWKIFLILETLETSDSINNSILNTKHLLFFGLQTISTKFLKIHREIFSAFFFNSASFCFFHLKLVRIGNSKNFILKKVFKF